MEDQHDQVLAATLRRELNRSGEKTEVVSRARRQRRVAILACAATVSGKGRVRHTTCINADMNSAQLARTALGGMLVFAGISHLTFARRAFQAQVPDWVPLDRNETVIASGIAEIALGSSLVLTDNANQALVGKIAAAFFVAVFPGNLSQYVNRRSAFGLDTDAKRFARLFFQPALVYWALKSTQTKPAHA